MTQTTLTHKEWERKLIGSVEHAVKFMRVSGYHNFEKHEPEYQMWKSLNDALQREHD